MSDRAIVQKYGHWWHVCHVDYGFMVDPCRTFPTHTAALAHALAATGLTPSNPEKETRHGRFHHRSTHRSR